MTQYVKIYIYFLPQFIYIQHNVLVSDVAVQSVDIVVKLTVVNKRASSLFTF